MAFKPDKYQIEIAKTFRNTSDNITIKAGAGTGKTTTLIMLLGLARGLSGVLAFNGDIVEELKKRVNIPNVEIMTLHSLGMKSLISEHGGRLKLKKGKTYKFIINASKKWNIKSIDQEAYFYIVDKLVDIYRSTLCQSIEDLKESAKIIGIEYKESHIKHSLEIMKILNNYNKNPKEVDFTDMIYLPATNIKYILPKFNTTFIDECQDLNKAQHAMIDRIIKGNRFVAVGDPHQSIYNFAGADSKSFQLFTIKKRTIELPLSVCYRCPSRIIDHANNIYNVLEPRIGVEPGVLRRGDYFEAEDKDMVICRNLKPLIMVYFNFIADGKKCFIKGKDIGESLIKIIKKWKDYEMEEMIDGLMGDLHDLTNDLIKRGFDKPIKHPSYQTLLEKISAIIVISNNYKSVKEMLYHLGEIFSDDSKEGIILSTIHKAKGLEANRIFFLNRFLIPSKFAVSEDQLIQENNLLYVAMTRAKKELIYCTVKEN